MIKNTMAREGWFGDRRGFLKKIFRTGMVCALISCFGLTACESTGGTTTFNTAELNKDATAIAYAAQVIETMPGVADHLSAADKATFDNVIAQIKSVTASIEASSSGSVSVDTGKDWAKHLGDDLNTLLTLATPIVKVYYPSAVTYMTTVQAMIPLVEALAGVTAVPHAAPSSSPEMVRARIYQGV